MTTPPLLDTHVWIWWMIGDARLPARERNALDNLPSGQRPKVAEMNRLPRSFHQDPADRLIAANARAAGLSLATHDARIRRSRLATLWAG